MSTIFVLKVKNPFTYFYSQFYYPTRGREPGQNRWCEASRPTQQILHRAAAFTHAAHMHAMFDGRMSQMRVISETNFQCHKMT